MGVRLHNVSETESVSIIRRKARIRISSHGMTKLFEKTRLNVYILHAGEPKTQFLINICRIFRCSEQTATNKRRADNPIHISPAQSSFSADVLFRSIGVDWVVFLDVSMWRGEVHGLSELLRAFFLAWCVFKLRGGFVVFRPFIERTLLTNPI